MDTKDKRLMLRFYLIFAIPVIAIGIVSAIILHVVAKGSLAPLTATILIMILSLIVAAALCRFIMVVIGRIKTVASSLGSIADGTMSLEENNLTNRNDEIGRMMRSVNTTITNFAKVVTGIHTASESLNLLSDGFRESFASMAASMEQVSCEVDSITQNTATQADKTIDIEAKIMEISQAIEVIAKNVDSLTQSADKMKEYNESSDHIMKNLITISQENKEAVDNVRSQTDLTNQSALEIRQATEIIAGIAGQTNLLALNASIEAARAGEQGKGFAVVAEEIRILADQSRESSEQINRIVNTLIENSNISVDTTKKVSEAFLRQNEKINETEEILNLLNQEIEEVSTSISEISTEITSLDHHKDMMKNGIVSLADAAKLNTNSATETLNAMNEFEQIVKNCKETTEQITSVAKDLIDNIEKVNSKATHL